MVMSDIIIKSSQGMRAYYYDKSSCRIYKRELINGVWGSNITAAENARSNFSIEHNGKEAIIYQQLSGNICIADESRHSILLENTGGKAPDIIINIIQGESPKLIYNIVGSDGRNKLINQFKIKGGIWSQAEVIDEFEPPAAEIAALGSDRYILIYSKKMPEIQFGFREIIGSSIKSFKMVYATGQSIRDFSYLITRSALHFVFLQTKGALCRLLYVRRDNEGLSRAVVVAEGFNFKSCAVGIVKNKLHIWWVNNRVLSYVYSYDFGVSFNRIEVDRNVNGLNIKKFTFRDNTPVDENNYAFNQVFVCDDRVIGI